VRLLPLALAVLAACGTPGLVSTLEADQPDAAVSTTEDAGAVGVMMPDAGVPDAGAPDAGSPDAGRGPPYPIVLAHGFFGFERFAGADFLTYFYEVKDELAAHGEREVFTPSVDPFNDSLTRSARLLTQLEAI
jgi:triacylglycerol lipase